MAETPGELREQAAAARTRLDQDLNRLEYQIKRAADWRVWYRRHTRAFLAAAFGLAVLISFTASSMLGGRRHAS